MKKTCLLSFFPLLFCSCNPVVLDVTKVPLSHERLASTFVGSPDPLQKDPFEGERLYIKWKLPDGIAPEKCSLELYCIYKDLTQDKMEIPLHQKKGEFTYTLVGEEYEGKKGFFSYKAVLKDEGGKEIKSWQHQMWVHVLED